MGRKTIVAILFFVGLLLLITTTPVSFASIIHNRSNPTIAGLTSPPTSTPDNWTPEPTLTPGPTPTSTPAPYYPTLYISYREGTPGSAFTVWGLSFVPEELVSILINNRSIGNVEVQNSHSFAFHLDTTSAEQGLYTIITQAQTAADSEFFILDTTEPFRLPLDVPWVEEVQTFLVPGNIAFTHQIFLPIVVR